MPLKERGSVDRVVHERSGEVIPLELLGLSEEDALLHLVEANTKPL